MTTGGAVLHPSDAVALCVIHMVNITGKHVRVNAPPGQMKKGKK